MSSQGIVADVGGDITCVCREILGVVPVVFTQRIKNHEDLTFGSSILWACFFHSLIVDLTEQCVYLGKCF